MKEDIHVKIDADVMREVRAWAKQRGITITAAISVLLATALGLGACGTPAVPPACRTAIAHEVTVVGGNNRIVAALNAQGYNVTSVMLPAIWHQDRTAARRVDAACPTAASERGALLPT